MVHTGLGKRRDLISKITGVKRAEGVVQVVQRLPSKCEALSSHLGTTKIKQEKKMCLTNSPQVLISVSADGGRRRGPQGLGTREGGLKAG
jgi:hypothetical protein